MKAGILAVLLVAISTTAMAGGFPNFTPPGQQEESQNDNSNVNLNGASSTSGSRSDSSSVSNSKSVGVGIAEGGNATGGKAKQGQAQEQAVSSVVTIEGSSTYVEGDEDSASSAARVYADNCVSGTSAQSKGWGVSIGGTTTDCRSQLTASFYLKMEKEAIDRGDFAEAEEFKALAYDAALEANPTPFQEFTHHLKEFALDIAIPVGLLILVL